MSEDYEGTTILDGLSDIMETEQAFFQTVRSLDGRTRNHLVAAQMRNTSLALDILRRYMLQPQRQTVVMNIPMTLDMSGNFFEPVPVVPTATQIEAATERHIGVAANTTCAICQENVTCATRLRQCGHCFHGSCIDQWLQMNPRCPVCRDDIREQRLLRHSTSNSNGEDRSMHSDEE